MGIWWDGDLLREILDGTRSGGPWRSSPPRVRGQRTPQDLPGRRTPQSAAGESRPARNLRFRGFGRGRVGTIDKWDYQTGTVKRLVNGGFYDCITINGSKANPCLCADILGDWREEVIWRTRDGKELRIFSTAIPTKHRITTLMHDPVYRLGIAWQNVAYNQPAHTSYFLGYGM
jgi:rhamnogalacturonan endolyase